MKATPEEPPGPLVDSSELLPKVSFEDKIEIGHLAGDPISMKLKVGALEV